MFSSLSFSFVLTLYSVIPYVAGINLTTSSPTATNTAKSANNACAIAASEAARYVPVRDGNPYINAQTAYDCLKSVPIDNQAARRFISSLRPYLEFQSNIEYLQDPPSGYLYPKVNLHAELDKIEEKISKGEYAGEYDMQLDLVKLGYSIHDGHFGISPDLSTVFVFERRYELASVSADGQDTPQIYHELDIYRSTSGGGSLEPVTGYTPSPITKIDGQDVVSFLLTQSSVSLSQDPDSAWNQNFASLGHQAVASTWKRPVYYPGPSTTITFANGTSRTDENSAQVLRDLQGVQSGQDAYARFCPFANVADPAAAFTSALRLQNPEATPTPVPTVPDPSIPVAPTPDNPVPILALNYTATIPTNNAASGSLNVPYYPLPVIKHSADSIAGYYLDGTGLNKIAVLQVNDFRANNNRFNPKNWQVEFQKVLQDFLAAAVAAGKEKLIVDLQGNPGGFIDSGTDLIAQLFPSTAPNTKSDMRASLGMQTLTTLVSKEVAAAEATTDIRDDIESEWYNNPFAYQVIVDPDMKDYPDVKAFYGPYERHGGNYTGYFQNNYTDSRASDYLGWGITITGVGNRVGFTQPFKAENMIVLTDSICHSTCTVVSENLKKAGVPFITIGGRPQTGPMQAVGGVKGSQVFEFRSTMITMLRLFEKAGAEVAAIFKGTIWENFSYYTVLRTLGGGDVNGRNHFRIGDTTETPLQFVYEAADCRLFYTREMFYDPTFLWNRVAQVAFSDRDGVKFNSKYCVRDSTGHPTSLSGGLQPGSIGPQTPPANAYMTFKGWALNGKVLGPAGNQNGSVTPDFKGWNSTMILGTRGGAHRYPPRSL